jgi:hypothetical protein
MPNFVTVIKQLADGLNADNSEDQELARIAIRVLTAGKQDIELPKLPPRKSRKSWQPAGQIAVKEALLQLGDGATDEMIVEDIRNRQQLNELSKDDETAKRQVHSRVSGMKYVRAHRAGGWELVGSVRSQIRKPHAA